MRVRKLDNNGDWTFGLGVYNYIKDNDAVLQNVTTRLRSIKGDWFLDVDAGVDWIGLLGVRDNQKLIEDEVRRIVLETDLVTKVNDITIEIEEGRHAKITVSLNTIFNTLNNVEVSL